MSQQQNSRPANKAPKSTALATYEMPSYDDLKEEKTRMSGSTPLLKLEPREKKYRLRLVPPKRVPADQPKLPGFVGVSSHFGDFGNKKIVSCNCPVKMKVKGETCAFCQYLERLSKSRNAADQQRCKDFAAKGAVFVNVVLRGTEEDPKVQTWRAGWTFMKWLDGKLADFAEDPANGNPFDPGPTGFDFTVKVEKKNGTTSYDFDVPKGCYGVALLADPSEMVNLINSAPDLRPYGDFKPYDEVRDAIAAAEGGGEAPRTGGYGRSGGMAVGEPIDAEVVADDDDDSDDDGDDGI